LGRTELDWCFSQRIGATHQQGLSPTLIMTLNKRMLAAI
jgi:hypothetical protein